MFKMFDFSFKTRSKTISPLINRSINEAVLVADHFNHMSFQLGETHVQVTCPRHETTCLQQTDKREQVPAKNVPCAYL